MGRQIRKSKGKTMKPNFFVFCEGESEVAYISHLRSQYRAPIQIIPRKSDSNISVRYIENCKREYVATQNDKTFLMFDLDVNGMLEHLQSIPDVVLLVSNWTLHKGNFGIKWETATVRKDIKSNSKSQGVEDI